MKSDNPTPAFIVGAGRCGSTLISNVLNTNPHILSLSEFFRAISDLGVAKAQCFPEGELSAQDFIALVTRRESRLGLMLRAGVPMEEFLYQPGTDKTYNRATGVPAILATTLPHLSNDYDALYQEVLQFLQQQTAASIGEHYSRLFDWLRQRFNRKLWVERSGASARMIPDLHRAFPHARFVHLVRDGRNSAISMSQHFGMRMIMLGMQLRHELGFDPFAVDAPEITRYVPEKFQQLLPKNFIGDAFRNFQVPPWQCGQYWSAEVIAALKALEAIPQNQVLTLRYEDFLNAPEQTIARLAFFLDKDIVTVDWIRKAAIKLRSPRSTWTNLDGKERSQLFEACKPGYLALGELYR